jgi:hypothetical protein
LILNDFSTSFHGKGFEPGSARLRYAAILCLAAPLIIAAPFSAIMIDTIADQLG